MQRPPAIPPSPAATVLCGDRSIRLDHIEIDPTPAGVILWIRQRDLPSVNGFELTPQGACRADVCISIPADLLRGEYVNLTAFARNAGQAVVAEPRARVWSFGDMPALGGGLSGSRVAPDVEIPDRLGRPVHLAGFRGKKVLVVTWASW